MTDDESSSKKKLKVQDLLTSIHDTLGLGSLKKKLEQLSSSSAPGKPSEDAIGQAASDLLAAPLSRRAQDRLNREAAYKESKEDIEKWAPTVKQNREAEHLSFPMNDSGAQYMGSAAMSSNFTVCPMIHYERQRIIFTECIS